MRETLLAECAGAKLRNDSAGLSEATTPLNELQKPFDEFRESIAQLNAAADAIRSSKHAGAADDSKSPDAG